jgi:hypothetical protein
VELFFELKHSLVYIIKPIRRFVRAVDFKMTVEMYAEITPAPATDRTEVLTGKWR